jgi:glycosyltransferase involved in cell wall biosynthesis
MSIKKQVILSPLIATSVINQADMIKKLLKSKGLDTYYQSTVSVYDIKADKNIAFLWFTLATVRYLGDAVFPYIYCKKPKAIYVTIEGVPTKANTLCSNLPKLDLIANSKFTKDCLQRAGLKVIDVVHHAVDIERCQAQTKSSFTIRKKWENEYGDRTKIIYVGRNDPRKALDRLAKALHMIPDELKEKMVLLLFTEGDVKALTCQNNVINVGSFGSISYDQVLQLIGASDYLVFPTISEGFGLPVLEANAMGIPAIHAWIPPLSEFSSKEFNFVFGHQGEHMVNNANIQYWVFHEYRPEKLAEMMCQAITTHQENNKEYKKFAFEAMRHAEKWDYKIIYPKLLRHIGIK